MHNKLIRRIMASLIISVMLFALPAGALIANSSSAISVYADEEMPAADPCVTDAAEADSCNE